jgi:hypothetical protein
MWWPDWFGWEYGFGRWGLMLLAWAAALAAMWWLWGRRGDE